MERLLHDREDEMSRLRALVKQLQEEIKVMQQNILWLSRPEPVIDSTPTCIGGEGI